MKKRDANSVPNMATTPKKKRTRKQKAFRRLAVLGSAAVIVGLAAGTVMALIGKGGYMGGIIPPIISPPHAENILLIGNNARNPKNPLDIGTGGGGQADIMMVAHLDPAKHSVVLISIPRDALFAMPQYNNPIPKLKSFFFIGAQMQPNQAAQLTVQAVQQFTGMHIDHYIVTDFQGFADAIDAVGGISIDVPGRIYDPAHSGADFYPGWQTMNGQQALAYIRVRQNTASYVRVNDVQRDDAQAQMLQALQAKLLKTGSDLAHLPALLSTWQKDVVTDMGFSDLVQAAEAVHGAKVKHIDLFDVGDSMQVASAPAPGINQENYITGAYYDIIDPAQVEKTLAPYGAVSATTGIPLPAPSTVPVQVYGSQAVVSELQAAGYKVTWMGSGNTYPAEINYPPGDMSWGLQVGRTLATGNSMVQPGSNPNAVVIYTE